MKQSKEERDAVQKIWLAANKEKTRETRKAWIKSHSKEWQQNLNKKNAQSHRDHKSGNWQEYHKKYMREYYAADPLHKCAHMIRMYAASTMKQYLKTGLLPKPNFRNRRPFDLEVIKNIIERYSMVFIGNQDTPRLYSINHRVSIPHILRFVGISDIKLMSLDIWRAIWSLENMEMIKKSENSRKRDFISQDVLKTALEMEENHPIMKGLCEYLCGVKHVK